MPLPRRVAHALDLANQSAVVVVSVEAGTPASAVGLEPGDVILFLDGEPVTGVDDLVRVLSGERIGKALPLTILRRGHMHPLIITPTAPASEGSVGARGQPISLPRQAFEKPDARMSSTINADSLQRQLERVHTGAAGEIPGEFGPGS